jgi:hypothetical protein
VRSFAKAARVDVQFDGLAASVWVVSLSEGHFFIRVVNYFVILDGRHESVDARQTSKEKMGTAHNIEDPLHAVLGHLHSGFLVFECRVFGISVQIWVEFSVDRIAVVTSALRDRYFGSFKASQRGAPCNG